MFSKRSKGVLSAMDFLRVRVDVRHDEVDVVLRKAVAPRVDAVHVFHWILGADGKVVRHPLAEGAAIWRRYLAVLPAEAPCFLEFLPGDAPFLLPQEAASLRPPFAG